MSTVKKKAIFSETEEGIIAKEALRNMVEDRAYRTDASYSANSLTHPDHLRPFIEKHMSYLTSHPSMDPRQYLSNLRLMTRIR